MDFVNHHHKNNNKINRNKTNKDSKHKEEILKESMKEQKKIKFYENKEGLISWRPIEAKVFFREDVVNCCKFFQ